MPKISITLPNVAEISMEAEDASEMRQIVGLVKSDLLNDLVRLHSEGPPQIDVNTTPAEDINVTGNGSAQAPVIEPAASSDDQASTPAAEEPPKAAQITETPPTRGSVTANDSTPRAPASAKPASSAIPPQFSDPRLEHDFTVFCRTVNPMGDMRKVVVAAEGAARMFSMGNVDAWELGHLFDMAGWAQPHSFTQALRNAARSKFRWLERVPGRAGRYFVTDAGRELVFKGTNVL